MLKTAIIISAAVVVLAVAVGIAAWYLILTSFTTC